MTSSPRNPSPSDRDDAAGADAEAGRPSDDDGLPAAVTGEPDQHETAAYIEALSAELRAMAGAAGLESLAYFLEMVRIEASIQVERMRSRAR